MTVIPEQTEQCKIMSKAFLDGSSKRHMDSKNELAILKQSQINVEAEQKENPIGKRTGINRMSMALTNLGSSTEDKATHKNPKNVISGLGYGGAAFAKGIFYGITGLVTEPYKGAKKKGAKGLMTGVGKGFVGLVAKPVGGTVGLVGCTVQGAVNTPGTIKSAVTTKGKKGGPAEEEGASAT